jgi:hypothetical protein
LIESTLQPGAPGVGEITFHELLDRPANAAIAWAKEDPEVGGHGDWEEPGGWQNPQTKLLEIL